MPAPADLVHETSTTTGTGNFTVAETSGKRRFSSPFGTGGTTNVFDYFISHRTAVEWEIGTGHMSDANTLVRDTVVSSSNSNSAVSFSAGTKDITNDIPASKQMAYTSSATTPSLPQAGHLWYDTDLGLLFVYINDGSSSQWVEIGGGIGGSSDSHGLVKIASGTASGASTQDIVLTSATSYRAIKFFITNLSVSVDGAGVFLRTSSNGGSSYDSGASDYQWTYTGREEAALSQGDDADSEIQLCGVGTTAATSGVGSAAGETFNAEVTLFDQTAAVRTQVQFSCTYWDASGTASLAFISGGGSRLSSADVDAIQFLPSSGTFSFSYAVYGMV